MQNPNLYWPLRCSLESEARRDLGTAPTEPLSWASRVPAPACHASDAEMFRVVDDGLRLLDDPQGWCRLQEYPR